MRGSTSTLKYTATELVMEKIMELWSDIHIYVKTNMCVSPPQESFSHPSSPPKAS